jgi:hypothetical protein
MTQPAELEGLDNFTALIFKAGALAKLLGGDPFLLAALFDGSHSFLDGRLHEYGTTFLVLAGLLNVLAVSKRSNYQRRNHASGTPHVHSDGRRKLWRFLGIAPCLNACTPRGTCSSAVRSLRWPAVGSCT